MKKALNSPLDWLSKYHFHQYQLQTPIRQNILSPILCQHTYTSILIWNNKQRNEASLESQ